MATDLPTAANVHADSQTITPVVPELKPKAVRARTNPIGFLKTGFIKTGLASWYGKVLQDHRTASGRRFNMFELTAAHRSLPFGSKVKVTDLRSKKSVVVTITDRGVMDADRVIDLSYAAAEQLGMVKSGVDPVRLEVLTQRQIELAEARPPVPLVVDPQMVFAQSR